LNEIVNAPDKFVSRSPHLVVAQVDWIQSRYLFVKCNMPGLDFPEKYPTQVHEQDPTWTPKGSQGQHIMIPVSGICKSRRNAFKKTRSRNKRVKNNNGEAQEKFDEPILVSDDTDFEDVKILLSEDDGVSTATSNSAKDKTGQPRIERLPEPARTDFIPGTLDHYKLPLLKAPSYATSTATKALQRELNNTLQVQKTHPAHELGWYIDPNLVTNIYQWIVELHSFDPQLPLANDMTDKSLKSIILEIRFGKDYPISPPFIRVIRPRFLSFMSGGGGHVTAGGALCMELLTNSGWSAVSSIESVLLQVRLAMSSTDPQPARLEPGPVRDYGVGEAVEAFLRACNAHGVSHSHQQLKNKPPWGL
jgi:ubiquitin-conjugating enzyme E2 Q